MRQAHEAAPRPDASTETGPSTAPHVTAQLHAQGVLTAEEFAAAKAKILGT